MMRVVVTGIQGQLARALGECASSAIQIVSCGRPELDLLRLQTIEPALRRLAPDIIVSAAAYTQVDLAESERELAYAVNRGGAGAVAKAAASLGVPVIHMSTDYVFGGAKAGPLSEEERTLPQSVYGASKLEGEHAVRSAHADHVILRTAWVYSPFGRNFLKTMLRLAEKQTQVRVVDDQIGCPTSAADLATGVLEVARNVLERHKDRTLFGTFHMTGGGQCASWAEFAQEIMCASHEVGGPAAIVERIGSELYPTPARRPSNSCLSNDKLARVHGITLPDWHRSCRAVVRRLLAADLPIKENVQ